MKYKNIQLKNSLRMHLAFEQITGRPFGGGTPITDITILFYSAIITSESVRDGSEKAPALDEVMDYLDSNPDYLQKFGDWVQEQSERDKMLRGSEGDNSKKKP